MQSGARLGPYEIVAPVGAGGMGEVYRAKDTRLGRDVAIKVLPAEFAADPERLRRFEREARAVAALNHPNILAIHDVGTHERTPYLVTELLEGESLRERLQGGALPVRKAVEIGLQIAQGLAAAHEKGIVHRDLKPGNVFVTKDGHVKILDFGLAKLAPPRTPEEEARATTVMGETEPGVVMGTVAYMSPEQVRGRAVDHRSDIFSFGCVLYEMLGGEAPFRRDTAADTTSAILHEDPVFRAGAGGAIPSALCEVVNRCLEKRPEERFSSAHDVALALRLPSITGEATPHAAPATRPGITERRRRILIAAAALAAGAAITTTVPVWRPWRPSGTTARHGPDRIPSVLALPCKVNGAADAAFLTDAVPNTIATLLSNVEGIDTKVPPTSLEVDKVKGDLGAIAELYQVSSFVVTAVNASPQRFALNVQLVDAATRKVRWGRELEGPREAYNDLARQAAEGVRVALSPSAAAVPTAGASPEVELALREGDYFSRRYGELASQADFEASLVAYQRALRLAPSQCLASAKIAALYEVRHEIEGVASTTLQEAERWARRALDLDGRCGEAWAVLGFVEMLSTKPDIERELDCALKAATYSPREAVSHMTVSNVVGGPGTFALQLAAALRGVEIDPFFLPVSGNVVWCLSALGRAQEALPFSDRAMRVEPEDWANEDTRALMLVKLGRFDEAHKVLARGEAQFRAHPDAFRSQLWGQVRFALAAAERDSETLERLGRPIVSALLDGRTDSLTLGNGAQILCPGLARLGRSDDAVRILLRGVEAGVPPPYDWLLLDADLQLLRSDHRFGRVLLASREGAARIAKLLESARSRGELPAYLEQPLDDLVKLLKANEGPR